MWKLHEEKSELLWTHKNMLFLASRDKKKRVGGKIVKRNFFSAYFCWLRLLLRLRKGCLNFMERWRENKVLRPTRKCLSFCLSSGLNDSSQLHSHSLLRYNIFYSDVDSKARINK